MCNKSSDWLVEIADQLAIAFDFTSLLGQQFFESRDADGLRQFIQIAFAKGRAIRPDLHPGICGEGRGVSKSIHFFRSSDRCEFSLRDTVKVSISPFPERDLALGK